MQKEVIREVKGKILVEEHNKTKKNRVEQRQKV